MPNPDNATAEEINVERIDVAQWGSCYRDKFRSLVRWVEGLGK